jgi:hypothetical protein
MYLASLPLIEGAHQKQPNLSMNLVELDSLKSGDLAKLLIYDDGSEGGRTN